MLAHPCLPPPARGPTLPAAVVAWDSCGTFLARPDGRIERLPRHWLARHGSGTGRTYGAHLQVRFVAHRMELRSGATLVWRAAQVYPDYAGGLAFGPRGLFAFATYRRGVFLTRAPARERLVLPGRGLYPIGFTGRGDLLVAVPRGRISVLTPSGRIVLRIRYRARNGLVADDRSLVWVTPRGRLAELSGRRIRLGRRVVASGWMQQLPRGRVALVDRRSLVVLDRSGAVVARGTVRHGTIDSGISGSADGERFAFRVVVGRMRVGTHVRLYVLREGSARPRLLARHRVRWVGCANGAGYGWHGSALLYSASDGTRLAIDTTRARVVDLAVLLRALPHRGRIASTSVGWRSDFN